MSYAITFDMNTTALKKYYHGNNYQNAYGDIERIFNKHGLIKQQGSVYFGIDLTDVQCIVAVQDLVFTYPWFHMCVSDIQMLQILTHSDMAPAINAALSLMRINNFEKA